MAAVAAVCLSIPSRHSGKVYRLGYEAKTYYELAEVFTETLGQAFTYEPQPPSDFLRNVLAAGAEPAYMKCVFDSYTDLTNGVDIHADETFENFPELTGRQPHTLAELLGDTPSSSFTNSPQKLKSMSNEMKIRVGLVGLGNWGQYGHIPALRLLPEYEIVALSSRSMETARELAVKFAIPNAFADYSELVNHGEVDLVVVLPPAPQHATIVKAAIAAGKDVYCEWPLTTSTDGSEELLRLAEEAGVRHFVGLQRTVGASSLLLSELIATRYLGNLRSVRMDVSMSGFGPVRSKSLDWTIPAANFSHVLSIYGGHFMDMLFDAVGQPASLNAIVKTQFPEVSVEMGPAIRNETPDAVMLMGTLQNGALFQVHIEGGKLNRKGLHIEITGTEGNLEVSNERAFVTKHHDVINGRREKAASGGRLRSPISSTPFRQPILT